MKTLTKAEIYWDTQDPANEGWAYRATDEDRQQESGNWDWPLADNADGSGIQDAVIHLAYQYGTVIVRDDVHADPSQDGGYAVWDRDQNE